MQDRDAASAEDGWRGLARGGNGGRFAIVAGGVALHAVSIYVVATIMPVVVGEIGGIAFFAWTATLYIAGSLTGAAIVPTAVARLGVRGAYRIGFLLFMAGSLVCAIAPSMPTMLAGRLVQGLGGGMLPALAYATIRSILPARQHARAIALLGTVWGVAALLGPLVGGVFAQMDAWRGAFGIDLLVGLVFVLLTERLLPAHVAGEAPQRRFPGLRLALLAAAAIAVSAGGVVGAGMPAAIGIVAAALLVLLTLRLDARLPTRLLVAGAFRPSSPIGAVSATMALVILATSPCTFVPYLLRVAHGVSPLTGGYLSAVLALAWTAASLVTASAGPRLARATIVAGPALMAVGLVLDGWGLARGSLAAVAIGQAAIGAGIGVGWAHLGAMLMRVAPPADRDVAGPFITTTQTLAAAFGSAIAGMVANLAGIARASSAAEAAAVAPWLFGTLLVFPLAACVTAVVALASTRGETR